MALPLQQTQAISELAKHLYSFLPGKPYPFADQSISFQAVAAALGLNQFWRGGSKLPAIHGLLIETLRNRSDKFCPLLIETVQRGIAYRQSKNDPITYDEIERLNQLIARVGFKIPELHEPRFLDTLPRKLTEGEDKTPEKLNDSIVQALYKKLLNISLLPPQEKGFKFQDFLVELFEIYKLLPRHSFRLVGEQIDGSLQFQGETYLVEATWKRTLVGQEELAAFAAKVTGKAQWSRGLYISYTGFSEDGLIAFSRGKPTSIVCMDGFDLSCILQNKISLRDALEKKVRRAAETNEAFIPIRELFPTV